MKTPGEILGRPLDLPCGAKLPNRILKSAMSETLADESRAPNSLHTRLYRTFALGGTGTLVTGNVMVDRRALGEPGNVAVEDERHLSELRTWAAAGTCNSNHLWMQINHPGKQAPRGLSRHQEAVAPSAIPLEGAGMKQAFGVPRELRPEEIEEIIARFARTAGIAKKAGFTGVQIHGAHGYLVSQFLSPRHNHRADEWGGTPEKRRKFALDVYKAMRAEVGKNYPVSIKINSADFMRGGFSDEESLDAVQALAEAGIDLIEISGGSYESPEMFTSKKSTREREAYFLGFAEKARKRIKTPLAVTGGFRSAEGMARAVESGAVDVVGLARSLCADPDIPRKVLAGVPFPDPMLKRTTGIPLLDKIGLVEATWYGEQLIRMAKGKAPDPKMSVLEATARNFLAKGLKAFQQRRA
ncbi:MAG: NADH:flavin oxidoreductase/NADH oxidase family protein [Bdellovibrionota bacterium]